MALNSFSELVSVTDNAVKLLNMEKIKRKNQNELRVKVNQAGSPFASPTSLTSNSDSGVEKTESKFPPSFPRGLDHKLKDMKMSAKSHTHTEIEGARYTPKTNNACSTNESSKEKKSINKQFESKSNTTRIRNSNENSVRSEQTDSNSSFEINKFKQFDSNNNKKAKSVTVQRYSYVATGGAKSRNAGNYVVQREANEEIKAVTVTNSEYGLNKVDTSSCTSDDSDVPKIIEVVSHDVEMLETGSSVTNAESQNMIDQASKFKQPKDNHFGQKTSAKTLNSDNQSLKQGNLNRGVIDPTSGRVFNDVYISQFGLTEKQKDLKEALAKRSENSQPKRKQIQAQFIQYKSNQYDDKGSGNEKNECELESTPQVSSNVTSLVTDSTMAAAVAASAAVAATQPFLKIQHELENQMKELVSQITELQKEKLPPNESQNCNDIERKRLTALEQQVTNLNERRMEHIESLQQQQLQMQAQLLMMSRSKSQREELYLDSLHGKRQHVSPSRNIQQISSIPRLITNAKEPNNKNKSYFPSSNPHYDSALVQSQLASNFNPGSLSKHQNYLSEVRELQGSLLDTPAPRKNIPQPTPYTLPTEQPKSLGFLHELLNKKENSHDTTFDIPQEYEFNRNNNSKMHRKSDKSPVDQARRLMTSLTNLEKETADKIWSSKENLTEKANTISGPAPIEQYLKYPKTKSSPYPTLNDVKKTTNERPNLDDILEAKKVLHHLEATRETLEKNIEQVVKISRDMHVFTSLLNNASEGEVNDNTRIERMVRKRIASLNDDIQRDAMKGLAEEEMNKAAAKVELNRLKTMLKKNPKRFEITRLQNGSQFNNKLAVSKMKPSAQLSAPSSGIVKRPTANKVKQPPQPNVIKDEKTMTRTYGKPEYQRGRTTIRDPYMHFKNTKKGKTAVMNESIVVRDSHSNSPKRQQSPTRGQQAPRQFFFSPTRGYIPVNQNTVGPIPGEMVQMAIPLGHPRMEPGVRVSAHPASSEFGNPITSTPVPVTAERSNAAVVSFLDGMIKQHKNTTKETELSKQVLPPIDIDSISPSSSRITDKTDDIQIRSPQQANPNVTFLQEMHNSDLDKTLTEDDYSADEQDGIGLEFPGYDPKLPEYSGPAFPPNQVQRNPIAGDGPMKQTQLLSDVMAEDLRRRDVLENNVVSWLEQELMARVLTEVMPVKVHTETGDDSDVKSEKSEVRDESLLVADMIGQGGLQLFIDAGQPVDNGLVHLLIAEVIQEKVNAMLALRDRDTQTLPVKSDKDMEKKPQQDFQEITMPTFTRIATPEPTPKSSPVASPRHVKLCQGQLLATPPHSPPADGFKFSKPKPMLAEEKEENETDRVTYETLKQQMPSVPVATEVPSRTNVGIVEGESDSDVTWSVDISEELRRVAAQDKKLDIPTTFQLYHDVSTPPFSPSPTQELELNHDKPFYSSKQATPPASPPPFMSQPDPMIIETNPSPAKVVDDIRAPPEEKEEEERSDYEKAKITMMSIAVGNDSPMDTMIKTQEETRSPSKFRQDHQMSQSLSSEHEVSEDSSISETVNENISEGQWLLSRSEGQILGLPGKGGLHDLRKGYQQMVDLSTASTLHDTDDLEMDSFGIKSEGEVLIKGLPTPDEDPMLELMVQLQRNPRLAGYHDVPDSHIQQMMDHTTLRNNVGRSLGEMSVGQVAPSRVIKVQSQQNGERKMRGRGRFDNSPSDNLDIITTDDYRVDEHGDKNRRPIYSPSRQKGDRRSPSPQHQRRSPSPQHEHSQRLGSTSPVRVRSPRHASPVQRVDSRDRSRKQMQYQPVLSEGAPMSTRRQPPRQQRGALSKSSDHQFHSTDRGFRGLRESTESYAYSADQTSQSLESGSIRKSGNGVLTSSLKSGQSGVKKSVEFDLTGTYERKESMKSSVAASRETNRSLEGSSRLSQNSRSLGIDYSYSIDDDSIDDSELKRIVGDHSHSGPYRMSVTLPSTMGDESDVSDFNK